MVSFFAIFKILGVAAVWELIQHGEVICKAFDPLMTEEAQAIEYKNHFSNQHNSTYVWKGDDWYTTEVETHQIPSWAIAWVQTVVNLGSPITAVFPSLQALADIVGDFNDFMDEVEAGLANSFLIDELTEYDDNGKRVLKNLSISLPGGPTLLVVDSNAVMNFRLNLLNEGWKGFSAPTTNVSALGFRMKPGRTFQFSIPGTDQFLYVDPYDHMIKPGYMCTPPQAMSEQTAEYITVYLALLMLFYKILDGLGLTKLVSAWIQKLILKRQFVKTRNMIEKIVDQHDADVKVQNDSVIKQTFDIYRELNNGQSKLDTLLSRKGYRAYGHDR